VVVSVFCQFDQFVFDQSVSVLQQAEGFGVVFEQVVDNFDLLEIVGVLQVALFLHGVELDAESEDAFDEFVVAETVQGQPLVEAELEEGACEYDVLDVFEVEGDGGGDLFHVL
jgi:imidazolonepropionase-like amidohydrolase